MEVSLEELCADCPAEFLEYMFYVRKLKYEENPDYQYCIELFVGCMKNIMISPSSLDFCWKKQIKMHPGRAVNMNEVIQKRPAMMVEVENAQLRKDLLKNAEGSDLRQ